MVSMNFKATWKTLLLPVLGILAFFIYIYFFNVDILTIIASIQKVDLKIYSLAVVFVVVDTLFFSLSWLFLLDILSVKLSVVKSFLYVFYGMFIDIIIPAESISGEISKVYLIEREQKGTSGKVIASLVVQRIMGMGSNIIGLLVGTSVLLAGTQISGLVLNLTLFLAVASTISLVLLIFFCFREAWTLKVIDVALNLFERLSRRRWNLTRIREDVIKGAKIFHDSMKEFGHAPKTLFTSLFFNVLAWLLSLGIAYLVFLSMGFSINWSVIVITHSVISAIHGIPIGIPFEAGLPEITMTTLYMALLPEIPFETRATVCATATILTRILTVWLRFFIGFVAQQGLEIKAITATKTNSEIDKTTMEKMS
jgi:uncharacterized protein (TIRG00374 family)